MTVTAMSDRTMAKKAKAKGRPAKPGGEGIPIRVDSDVAMKAKYLATAHGIPTSEYISRLLRPLVEADFKKAAKDVAAGRPPKGGGES